MRYDLMLFLILLTGVSCRPSPINTNGKALIVGKALSPNFELTQFIDQPPHISYQLPVQRIGQTVDSLRISAPFLKKLIYFYVYNGHIAESTQLRLQYKFDSTPPYSIGYDIGTSQPPAGFRSDTTDFSLQTSAARLDCIVSATKPFIGTSTWNVDGHILHYTFVQDTILPNRPDWFDERCENLHPLLENFALNTSDAGFIAVDTIHYAVMKKAGGYSFIRDLPLRPHHLRNRAYADSYTAHP